MNKLQSVAQYIYSQFEANPTKNENDKEYYTLGHSAPDCIKDIIKESHQTGLPDNWTHDKIHSLICDFMDNPGSNWLTRLDETIDNIVDFKIGELIDWAGSCRRWVLVDECMQSTNYSNLITLLQQAQIQELYNIAGNLMLAIKDFTDDLSFYGANFNLCGYMPDNEALFFSEYSDAQQYLIDEINDIKEACIIEKAETIEIIERSTNNVAVIVDSKCFFIFQRNVADIILEDIEA